MNINDLIIITTVTDGVDFGVDEVTPVGWHVGTIAGMSRDGSVPRKWTDVDGRTHTVKARDRFLIHSHGKQGISAAGTMAALAMREGKGDFPRLVDVKAYMRTVVHQPAHKATVIAEAGF